MNLERKPLPFCEKISIIDILLGLSQAIRDEKIRVPHTDLFIEALARAAVEINPEAARKDPRYNAFYD